jgi:hypothetical protein
MAPFGFGEDGEGKMVEERVEVIEGWQTRGEVRWLQGPPGEGKVEEDGRAPTSGQPAHQWCW